MQITLPVDPEPEPVEVFRSRLRLMAGDIGWGEGE